MKRMAKISVLIAFIIFASFPSGLYSVKLALCDPVPERMLEPTPPPHNSSSAPGYCSAIGGSHDYEYIHSATYTQQPGGTLVINVVIWIANPTGCTSGNPCPEYDNSPEYINAWIDWDGDKVFEESERVLDVALTGYIGINYYGSMSTSNIVTIPSGAVSSTWMRVNLGWGHDPNNPCEYSWTWGDIIDVEVTLNNIDLRVDGAEISISTPSAPNTQTSVNWRIHNDGTIDAENVRIRTTREREGVVLGHVFDLIDVSAGDEYVYSTTFNFDFDRIVVEVDPDNTIEEIDEDNNLAETHRISGRVEDNSGSGLENVKVEYREWEGGSWISRYISFTDDEGDYFVITNFDAVNNGRQCQVRASLEFSPDSSVSNVRLRIYDDSQWGSGRNKATGAETYSASTGTWTIDTSRNYAGRDIQFPEHNCVLAYETLVDCYEYWNGLTPSLAPTGTVDVEVNDDDYSGHTSYRHGNNIHFWHTRSDQPSSMAHEYAHVVSGGWGTAYNPVDENFANFGSCKSRGTDTYNYWGTNLDITDLEDTDGDNIAGGLTWGNDLWNFQLAGIYEELDTDEVYNALRTGPDTAREVYDAYSGTPSADIKSIFRRHGVNTAGWPPAGPGDPEVFTGIFSDYKVDLDGNGIAELLSIDIGLDIPSYGHYYLYGFLEDPSRDQYCFASIQQELDVGDQTVTLSFNGMSIYQNQLEGPYTLTSVYLADESLVEIDYRLDAYTTIAYSFSEFEPPAIFMTGNYFDYGLDSDGDGLFDFLAVDVELSVSLPGYYRVQANLYGGDNLIDWAETYISLGGGTQLVSLNYNGVTIYALGIDGPYTLMEVFIFDDSDTIVYSNNFLTYDTAAYSHTEFEEPEAAFTGLIIDYGIDKNGDGLFDYLTVDVVVSTSSSGIFVVSGQLYGDTGDLISFTHTSAYFDVGTVSVEMNFDGTSLRNSGINGPYTVFLNLYNPDFALVAAIAYTTSAYVHTTFQIQDEDYFSFGFNDFETDVDSDGLYDFLVIAIDISTDYPRTYCINGYLYGEDGSFVAYANFASAISAESTVACLNFSGEQIWRTRAVGGIFSLTIVIYDPSNTLVITLDDAYITSPKDYHLFQPPVGYLRDVYSDSATDVNSDGFFDYLFVNVGMYITIPGMYRMCGGLFDDEGEEIVWIHSLIYLNTGNQLTTLVFDGAALFKHRVDGPYDLRELRLYDELGSLIDYRESPHVTAAYSFSDFQHLIGLTGNYIDYVRDIDGDNIFDYLTIDVEVTLANPGYSIIRARLMDTAGDEIVWAENTTYLLANQPQIIQLNFEGSAIFDHGIDGPYYLRDVLIYHIGDPGQSDYVHEAYTTQGYAYTLFGILPDTKPPNTTLFIGSPQYIDPVGDVYVTSETLFTLEAVDSNEVSSGVELTSYKIYNVIHETGWVTDVPPISFHICPCAVDGTYFIDYNSTDYAGNMESTNTFTVILDNSPPTTTLSIGEPKYVSDITYVTPETSFTLEATDDTGSGICSIAYRIYNTTYDSGWLPYTAPFYLTSLTDGVYTIKFNSTDNLGNIEATNSIQVTLFSWNYIFTDSYGRSTTLKINTEHKFFQFITPDKDYGIRTATYMRVRHRTISIYHKDNELKLATIAINTRLDLCITYAKDLQTGNKYLLIDKLGTK